MIEVEKKPSELSIKSYYNHLLYIVPPVPIIGTDRVEDPNQVIVKALTHQGVLEDCYEVLPLDNEVVRTIQKALPVWCQDNLLHYKVLDEKTQLYEFEGFRHRLRKKDKIISFVRMLRVIRMPMIEHTNRSFSDFSLDGILGKPTVRGISQQHPVVKNNISISDYHTYLANLRKKAGVEDGQGS